MAETACNKNKDLFSRKLDFNLVKKLVTCYIWSIEFYGVDTRTVWEVDRKYVESFEMWRWRRIEFSWIDRVKNEEVLRRVKKEMNIL